MSDTTEHLIVPPEADIDPDQFRAAFSHFQQRFPGLSPAQLNWIATAMSDRRLAGNEMAQHVAAFVGIVAGPNLDDIGAAEAFGNDLDVLVATIERLKAEDDGVLQ